MVDSVVVNEKKNDDIEYYISQLKSLNGELNKKDERIMSIQEDYKKIFNLFPDMVILIDNNGSIIDLNKRSQIVLDNFRTNNSLIGEKWSNICKKLGCNWEKSIEKYLIESDVLYEKSKEIYVDKINSHFILTVTPVRKYNNSDYFIIVIKDITEVKIRELNLIKKQKLLSYIYNITDIFSRNLNINYIMDKIVEILSDIDNIDLAYIYKNCEDNKKAKKIREYYKNSNYNLNNINDYLLYDEFPRWKEYFNLNHIVCGTINDFPYHERNHMSKNNLKSICIVPIYTSAGFWGFIGFDSYKKYKKWSYDEEQLLKIAANTIGGEIHKWVLKNINNNEVENIIPKCVNY